MLAEAVNSATFFTELASYRATNVLLVFVTWVNVDVEFSCSVLETDMYCTQSFNSKVY